MSIKIVSFDFGGVFTDMNTLVPYEQVLFELLSRKFKGRISKKEIYTLFTDYIAYDRNERKQHKSGNFYKFFNGFLDKRGLSSEESFGLINEIFSDTRVFCKIRRNTKSTLRHLKDKNIKIVLTTDAMFPSFARKKLLQHWGIIQYFDMVLTSQEYGRKSGLRIFRKIIESYKVRPDKVLHIGDSIANDIVPASKIGFKTCLYVNANIDSRGMKESRQADYIVKNFREIDELVFSL